MEAEQDCEHWEVEPSPVRPGMVVCKTCGYGPFRAGEGEHTSWQRFRIRLFLGIYAVLMYVEIGIGKLRHVVLGLASDAAYEGESVDSSGNDQEVPF